MRLHLLASLISLGLAGSTLAGCHAAVANLRAERKAICNLRGDSSSRKIEVAVKRMNSAEYRRAAVDMLADEQTQVCWRNAALVAGLGGNREALSILSARLHSNAAEPSTPDTGVGQLTIDILIGIALVVRTSQDPQVREAAVHLLESASDPNWWGRQAVALPPDAPSNSRREDFVSGAYFSIVALSFTGSREADILLRTLYEADSLVRTYDWRAQGIIQDSISMNLYRMNAPPGAMKR